MKKVALILLSITIGATLLVGCSKKSEDPIKDTTVTNKETTTVASDDAKKAEETKKAEEDAKKDEEVKKAEEIKQASSTTVPATNKTSNSPSSKGSGSSVSTAPSVKSSNTTQAPTTPKPTQPEAPKKQSGIDWGLTNTLRSYGGNQGFYTGVKRPVFDQYLTDIVNGKMDSATAISQLKKISWIEVPAETSGMPQVPTQTSVRVVDYHANSTTSSDPIVINGQAGFPPSEYKQVIVTYDANTGKYTTHVLGVFFVYTTKN